jgi:hypothetical protein
MAVASTASTGMGDDMTAVSTVTLAPWMVVFTELANVPLVTTTVTRMLDEVVF